MLLLLLLHTPLYVGSAVALLRGGNDVVMMLGIGASSRWYGNKSPLSSSSGSRLESVIFGGSSSILPDTVLCSSACSSVPPR